MFFKLLKIIFIPFCVSVFTSCSIVPNFPQHQKSATEKKSEIHAKAKMIIGSIRIKVLLPMGRDITDTLKEDDAFIKKTMNTIHILTKKSAVSKLLLFQSGDTVSGFQLRESERLLRKNLKIRDARLITHKNDENGLYDVLIIIQDQFEYNAGASHLFETTTYTGLNRNLLGYGSTLSVGLGFIDNQYSHVYTAYNDPSLGRSYIDFSASYTDAKSNFSKGISLNRKMVTGLFRTGGGMGYIHTNTDRFFFRGDTIFSSYNSDLKYLNSWFAYCFPVKKSSDLGKNSVNYGITASYVHAEESIRNIVSDSIYPISPINKSGDRFIVGLGVNYSHFFKDSYIFRFMYTDDIPEGYKAIAIGGKGFNRYNADNYYAGIQVGAANNFKWGYLNISGQYLRYISSLNTLNNTGSTLKLIYLSPAWETHRFKNRVFFTANIKQIGNDIAFDRIYLNNEDGFLNVNSRTISGVTKTSFIVHNIVYTPYRPLGFNVGFFMYAAIANLNASRTISLVGKWYQAYGLGILLRNENLLINSVRLSVTYYPSFPETTYKLNPLWIYDLQIPDMNFNEPDVDM